MDFQEEIPPDVGDKKPPLASVSEVDVLLLHDKIMSTWLPVSWLLSVWVCIIPDINKQMQNTIRNWRISLQGKEWYSLSAIKFLIL